jgi:hypothetical protein
LLNRQLDQFTLFKGLIPVRLHVIKLLLLGKMVVTTLINSLFDRLSKMGPNYFGLCHPIIDQFETREVSVLVSLFHLIAELLLRMDLL